MGSKMGLLAKEYANHGGASPPTTLAGFAISMSKSSINLLLELIVACLISSQAVFSGNLSLANSQRRHSVHKNDPSLRCLRLAFLFLSATAFAQTYQNFVPPAGFATSAGEPSIGVNWNTGKILFGAILETDRVTISGNPATATWENVSSPETSVVSLDPILFTDSTTGRTQIGRASC